METGVVADDQVVRHYIIVGVFADADAAGTLETAVFMDLVMVNIDFRILETGGVLQEITGVKYGKSGIGHADGDPTGVVALVVGDHIIGNLQTAGTGDHVNAAAGLGAGEGKVADAGLAVNAYTRDGVELDHCSHRPYRNDNRG